MREMGSSEGDQGAVEAIRRFIAATPYTDTGRAIATTSGPIDWEGISINDAPALVRTLRTVGLFDTYPEIGVGVSTIGNQAVMGSTTWRSRQVGRISDTITWNSSDGEPVVGDCSYRRLFMSGQVATESGRSYPFRATTTIGIVEREDGSIHFAYGRGCFETRIPFAFTTPGGGMSAGDRSMVGGYLVGLILTWAWMTYGHLREVSADTLLRARTRT